VVPTRYLTSDLPPIGGRLRERPEDFFVEEEPLYAPAGEGEHVYLMVQKRNLPTLRVVRMLARHFGVPMDAVGYAGLKDKRAVTRQVFSVHAPGKPLEEVRGLRHEAVSVLWADRHTNKLRRGHLAGNRFSVRIRGVGPGAALVAERGLRRLAREGVPNRIGEQRFGYLGRNHLVGRALILGDYPAALDALLAPAPGVADSLAEVRALYARGEYRGALAAFEGDRVAERRVLSVLARGATPERALRAIDAPEREFFLTAFQSAVFNSVLDRRVAEGTFDRLLPGDLAMKSPGRAVFPVDEGVLADPETRGRLERFEVSPTGPMWGREMMRAQEQVDAHECEALRAAGLSPERIAAYDGRMGRLTGERKPLRVRLGDPEVEAGADEHGPYVRVAFDLPRGAFATSVLRELMKPELAGGGPVEEDE
jgi:tRNA pseudouridine13 synthase